MNIVGTLALHRAVNLNRVFENSDSRATRYKKSSVSTTWLRYFDTLQARVHTIPIVWYSRVGPLTTNPGIPSSSEAHLGLFGGKKKMSHNKNFDDHPNHI